MEIWKPINGYDCYYVSNTGQVKKIFFDGRERQLAVKVEKTNQRRVSLRKNGKNKLFSISRLVATAFLPNPLGLPEVNHKDENRLNDNVDNLEWCTKSYNINYGTRNERAGRKISAALRNRPQEKIKRGKESKKNVPVRLVNTGEVFYSRVEASDKYGINASNITQCCRGKRKSAGKINGAPAVWSYID